MSKIFTIAQELIRDAISACYELFKVMIPVIIGVKLLQEFDLIQYVALPLKPIMGLLGLPAELGLAWATAMVNSMYAGLIVFLSLTRDMTLNTEQVTIFAVLLLIGHGFLVEGAIAQRSGAKFVFQILSRLFGAFALGLILHWTYSSSGTLQEPAVILFQSSSPVDPTLLQWIWDETKNLLSIFGIVLGLMIMMRILSAIRAVDLMNALLRPILKLIGIGPKASTITIIGFTLGLAYGGGLIINEAQSGRIDRKDVFYSLTLMGLCHSMIEDTLLMMLIGGHLSGIFWGRMLFGLVAMTILVQITRRLPQSFCNKYLWGNPRQTVQ
ncbi:hypothetical protein SYK_09650 [Pseudodesulfovibrio nedwellii]|uniref:Nucleoside recognition protein n=1 Tax=Pseudodesulfovibrio nedwellii TaxID=2973072 RepID=A0ABM8AZA5_9BACT|nr:hypothetical protein [Pseudodesulfovibrio nedwellii]BDQ36605.1 hypothetical protein SYK_09650 [Pseudodesulfovibrio nedwellii]